MENIALDEIMTLLSSTELFKKLKKSILKDLAQAFKVVYVSGGETVIYQLDPADSLYIVLYGRLRAVRKLPEGKEDIVGEIGKGEVVGEIGLLSETVRVATVRATRDSVLLKLEKEAFYSFVKKYPEIMIEITKVCIQRLIIEKKALQEGNTIRTITLIPAGQNPLFSQFALAFVQELSRVAPTLHLNTTTIDGQYGKNASQIMFESDQNAGLASYLQTQESDFRYIVYEADSRLTPWTQRCLRQADHILLVGLHNREPGVNSIELELLASQQKNPITSSLVLLHKTNIRPTETLIWLKDRPVHNHFHVQLDSRAHLAKLIRYVTGHALSLVLSGGGVRGLAHIGILKALEELKIPIDMIGGCSMGALVGGTYAMGYDYQAAYAAVKDHLIPCMRKFDYTLPITSLVRGKAVVNALKAVFNELQTEDLWEKFFCVSTDLSKGTLNVHDHGLLWKSIRASFSLPAFFPPVQYENNLCVDGAIINNLPVDIMRQRINGGKILAVRLVSDTQHISYDSWGDWLSFWYTIKHLPATFRHSPTIPNIGEIIIASTMLSSNQYEKNMAKQANHCLELHLGQFGFLEYKSFDKIITAGYEAALPQLSKWLNV